MNGTDEKYRVELRLETATFCKAQTQWASMMELNEKLTSNKQSNIFGRNKILETESCLF